MTAPQSITSELQKVAPSAIIEMFELHLVQSLHGSSDIYRFHAGVNKKSEASPIIWAGNTYQPFPIECEGFEYTGNGQLPRPKLRAANILGTLTTVLQAVNAVTPGNDLIGAKLIRRRTLARYLDAVNFPGSVNPYGTPDSSAEFPQEIYYVARKVAENREVIEFELAAAFDLQGVRAPKRQCIANVCQWVYRSAECGYTGTAYFDANDNSVGSASLDVCGKRVSSCVKRFQGGSGYPPNIITAGKSDRLTPGQTLFTYQELVSPNGWFRLVMQGDGNLVVYAKNGSVVWASGTQGNGECVLNFSIIGDLSIYKAGQVNPFGKVKTLVFNFTATVAVLQNNANFVVYNASNQPLYAPGYPVVTSEPLSFFRPNPELPFGSFPGIGSYAL